MCKYLQICAEFGSAKVGEEKGLLQTVLSCMLSTQWYIPSDQRFDLLVLVSSSRSVVMPVQNDQCLLANTARRIFFRRLAHYSQVYAIELKPSSVLICFLFSFLSYTQKFVFFRFEKEGGMHSTLVFQSTQSTCD